MLILVVCLFAALIAEWFEPELGGPFVQPVSRAAKLRRTAVAFFVTGSAFLMFYALAGWKLLAGPSSACAAGADWGTNPPTTLDHSFLPRRRPAGSPAVRRGSSTRTGWLPWQRSWPCPR